MVTIGTQLGPYELLEEIGKGGMATVYRAYQPTVDRQVAVKVIHKSIAGDAQVMERFRREARIIARLEHPHILPVYDFDGTHDPPYIVMRYLDSGTLKDVLGLRQLPFDEVIHLLGQIAAALDYAHRQGVVHRDIKPSNIMLDREGNAVVSDFGLARLTVSADQDAVGLTKTGSLTGTPYYMAPEQVKGTRLDHRADIYALGVMAFEMLTGQLPYEDEILMAVLMKHLQDPIPSAVALNPNLPPAIDAVIARTLAKEANERYASVIEFAAEVVSVLGGTTATIPLNLRAAVEESMARTRLARAQLEAQTPTDSKRTPTAQHKVVTAMYASAAEYAELVEEAEGAEAARNALGALWTEGEEIIEQFGGQVFSRAEEALLALWGAEQAREDDPERALRAALELQATLRRLDGDVIEEAEDEPLPLKIGVSTGVALLTPALDSGDYTASGTTIRLANRLAERAEGVVLIAPDTYRAVRGVFEIEREGFIRMRGRKRRLETYRVTATKARAFRLEVRGVEGIETRLVRRKPELAQIQEAFFAAVEDEETQVVTVVSEVGLGKSRLLFEFREWAELRPETYRVFRGRAMPGTGTACPYALLRDVLAFRFEIHDSDSPAIVREKMEQGVAELIPVTSPEIAHLTGQLAGFDFSDSPYVKPLLDNPQELADRARAAFTSLFTTLCKNEPAVIQLEDLHHADEASLDLFAQLIREQRELSLLLVCAARPALYERYPSWGSGRDDIRLDLRPLSKREGRALVREILQKVEEVPKSLVNLIVERAEGNPYYVEELVKMLIEDRVIQKGADPDSPWCVEISRLEGWQLAVPTTLVGLLQSRLDSLLYPERVALQRAATVGRVFWDSAVQALEAGDDVTFPLEGVLAALAEREFIYKRETSAFEGSREYVFGQSMLRDVVYEGMVKRQQRAYHAAAAEWLIEAAGERVDEYALTIAGHYEQAGETGKATEYLLRGGDQARLAYANAEAIDCYRRALAPLKEEEKHEQAARTLMKLGLTYHNAFDFKAARQAYEEGFALWQQAGESREGPPPPPAPHAFRLLWGDPPTLDPSMASDTVSAGPIEQLFSGLVELSQQMDVVPDIAHSWEVSEGGRKYIFHLRDDVRWSDGRQVTAEDFEYAWKRALNPVTNSPTASLLYDVKGARAFHRGEGRREDVGIQTSDDVTLVVELEEPTGYLLHLLTHCTCYPVPRHVVEAHGQAWTEPDHIVTNGPFRLEAWQPGESMLLSRNPGYHGRFRGNLEHVELFLRRVEPATRLEMYEADSLDVIGLPPLEMDRARQRHAGEYISFPLLHATYVGFDASRPPFNDRRVRRAFVLATDKERLAGEIGRGYHSPATGGFVPPGMPGHSAGIGLPYDPAQARQLLAEAGYPGGRGFPAVDWLTRRRGFNELRCGYLQAQWQENLGIEIEWEAIEWVALLDKLRKEPLSIFLMGWTADYPDPDNFLRVGLWQYRIGWQNEVYNRLVEEARRSTDQAERMKLYQQADRLLVEEAAIIPLTHSRVHSLVKPWVSKYFVPAAGGFFWKDVVIEPH